jgi:hypothetical protein
MLLFLQLPQMGMHAPESKTVHSDSKGLHTAAAVDALNEIRLKRLDALSLPPSDSAPECDSL